MARKALAMPPHWTKQILSWDEVPIVFYTDTASIIFQKPEDTIRQWCQDKKIPAKRIGNQWFFEKDTICNFLRNGGISNENLHQCTGQNCNTA